MNLVLGMLETVASLVGLLIGGVAYVLLLFAFGRQKTHWMLAGLIRSIASLLAAPVHYVTRIARDLADVGERRATAEDREPYLLHRLLNLEKVAIILLACGILAGGVAAAWEALLPERWIRDARANVARQLGETATALKAKESEVEADAALAASRLQRALAEYAAPRAATVQSATAALAKIGGEISANADAKVLMDFIQSELQIAGPKDAADINRLHRNLRYRMAAATWVGGEHGPLVRWLDQWKAKALAEVELADAEVTVRADQQSKHAELVRARDRLRSQEESLQTEQKEVLAQYRFRWGRSAAVAASSYILFSVVVWILGLFAEIVGTWIVLAGDVREIRGRAVQGPNH